MLDGIKKLVDCLDKEQRVELFNYLEFVAEQNYDSETMENPYRVDRAEIDEEAIRVWNRHHERLQNPLGINNPNLVSGLDQE